MDIETGSNEDLPEAPDTTAAVRLFTNSPESHRAFGELAKLQPELLLTSTGDAYLKMLGKQ